jgi:VWFA-related protein
MLSGAWQNEDVRRTILFLSLVTAAWAQTKLQVTVVDRKTGEPVLGLKAGNFAVLDDRTPRPVQAAEFDKVTLDVMLLFDTSLVGEAVYPLGGAFIEGLEEKEQMAIVSFASSAELIQDFTSSKDLLRRAVRTVKYGNTPRVIDALYAASDGGFQSTIGRKVIVLLSAGVEGYSRTPEREVLKLCRSNQISIFPVFVVGAERSLFEKLARETGGAFFSARDLRLPPPKLAERVYTVLRGRYVLTLADNRALGDRVRVEVTGADPGVRVWASGMPMD